MFEKGTFNVCIFSVILLTFLERNGIRHILTQNGSFFQRSGQILTTHNVDSLIQPKTSEFY